MILTAYSTTENAREIRVKSTANTTVITSAGVDVTQALIDEDVLTDAAYYENEAIIDDICAAVDSFGLFGAPCVAEACPVFNTENDTERVGVSLYSVRYERDGRNGLREYRTYKIARYLNVPDASAATAQRATAPLLQLVKLLCNLRLTYDDGSLYVVDAIEAEPLDSEQLLKNLLYFGYIDLTITTALN